MKWHTDFTQKTFPAVHQWFLTTLVLNVCSLGAKKTGATNTPPPLRNEYLILEFCGDGQSVFLLFLLLFDRRGRGPVRHNVPHNSLKTHEAKTERANRTHKFILQLRTSMLHS